MPYSFLARTDAMGFLFAHREFPELELSAQPAERKAQVRVLETVLSVVEATAAHLDALPADDDVESFDELKRRRDATSVVRLR